MLDSIIIASSILFIVTVIVVSCILIHNRVRGIPISIKEKDEIKVIPPHIHIPIINTAEPSHEHKPAMHSGYMLNMHAETTNMYTGYIPNVSNIIFTNSDIRMKEAIEPTNVKGNIKIVKSTERLKRLIDTESSVCNEKEK